MRRARRFPYILVLLAVIGLGLATRRFKIGWRVWDESVGDVLYAVATYLALRVLAPRLSRGRATIAAAVFCFAIEAFKLTGLPAAWADARWSRLLFGTTASWHNVICYVIGVTAAAIADASFCAAATRRRYSLPPGR